MQQSQGSPEVTRQERLPGLRAAAALDNLKECKQSHVSFYKGAQNLLSLSGCSWGVRQAVEDQAAPLSLAPDKETHRTVSEPAISLSVECTPISLELAKAVGAKETAFLLPQVMNYALAFSKDHVKINK